MPWKYNMSLKKMFSNKKHIHLEWESCIDHNACVYDDMRSTWSDVNKHIISLIWFLLIFFLWDTWQDFDDSSGSDFVGWFIDCHSLRYTKIKNRTKIIYLTRSRVTTKWRILSWVTSTSFCIKYILSHVTVENF